MPTSAVIRQLWLITLLLITTGSAHASVAELQVDVPYVRVAPENISYLFGHEDIPAERILSGTEQLPWRTANNLLLDPAVSDEPVWVKLTLHNPSDVHLRRILEIQWVNIDYATLYQPDRYDGLLTSQNGLAVTGNALYAAAPNFLFPLDLAAGSSTDILMHISTRHMYLLPIYIWQEDDYDRFELFYYTLYGLFFGAILVMFFYNLSLWIFIRDNTFLLYCVYLIATITYILAATGIGKHIIWHDFSWLRNNAYGLFAACGFFTAGVFIINFLKLWQRERWMLYSGITACGYWTLEIIANLLSSPLSANMTNTAALATSVLAFTITTRLAIKGDRIAITFAIAWGFLISSTIILMLMLLGIVPQNFITQHIQSVGFLLETVLISIALAQRFNRERDLRERAQSELLKLQSRTNKELEQRVKERTEALEVLTRQLAHNNTELHQLSVTDGLTELHNRRSFDIILKQEILRSRTTGRPFALIMADIDHFKQFNDSWGHVAGDECLRRVAHIFNSNIRHETDCAARYGGEEFALILPGMELEEAIYKAETIRRAVGDMHFNFLEHSLQVTISLGVTALTAEHESAEQITAMADKALYQAKELGRNQVCVYREDC